MMAVSVNLPYFDLLGMPEGREREEVLARERYNKERNMAAVLIVDSGVRFPSLHFHYGYKLLHFCH